ncbi:ATP-binding protein [Roseomonas sp. AR75]|uniref:ATP-binding protein n=1 Tax=Roseomonas sp. AR75 TaxID=2562311 RepID=UPI0034D2981A
MKGLVACRGRNGAGKSSLANAISWVLTGLIQRPQTAPAKPGVDTAFHVSDEHHGHFPPGARDSNYLR